MPDFSDIPLTKTDILTCFNDRRSLRKYSKNKVSLQELSYLLWATQGVSKILKTGKTLRTVPSACKAHPFETYLIVKNIQDLKSGIYKYQYLQHKLLPLYTDMLKDETIIEACGHQSFVKNAAVMFIWSCIPERSEKINSMVSHHKAILLDAGHLCQNLYLASESINSGACAIAAYNQEKIDSLLGVDTNREFVVYMASVGKK